MKHTVGDSRYISIPVQLRLLLVLLSVGVSALAAPPTPPAQPITPIPLSVILDPDKVALGEQLFRDPKLSEDGQSACSSCHDLAAGGDDGQVGAGRDHLNTPTIFNVAYNASFGWLGRYPTLKAQAHGDLSDRSHDNQPWPDILDHLQQDAAYQRQFQHIYAGGISRDAVLDTLTTYEHSLITPNAPFDRWLRGDADALGEQARDGYQHFKHLGCISCHQGVNIGGNVFQRIGIFADFFADKPSSTKIDMGRYILTGRERDRHVFRVPSLRNVAVTAPYFHDGRTDSLDDAIKMVGHYQLNLELSDTDVTLLRAFLESLTGEYQQQSLAHQ